MMQLHLNEISRNVTEGAHAVLLLDRAGWHTTGKLAVPENITPIFLPSRAPELNPVENVWQYLRQNWLSNTVFENYDAISTRPATHGESSSPSPNGLHPSECETGLTSVSPHDRWYEIEKADRLAGIERVLANEILDLSFCFVVERVIGGAHVREFCLSTVSRDGSPGQQRINGCDRRKELSECHSRPPSLNSQIRSSGVVTEPLRVGLEKWHATAETFLSALSNMARRFVALIAELLGEDDVLLVRQRLVAENKHSMFRHALMTGVDITPIKRLRAIDRQNFASKRVRHRADHHCHFGVPLD